MVAKVERCRQAILEGLRVEFAHQPAPPLPGVSTHKVGPPPPPPHYPGFNHYSGRGRGRGIPGRTGSHPGKLYHGASNILSYFFQVNATESLILFLYVCGAFFQIHALSCLAA